MLTNKSILKAVITSIIVTAITVTNTYADTDTETSSKKLSTSELPADWDTQLSQALELMPEFFTAKDEDSDSKSRKKKKRKKKSDLTPEELAELEKEEAEKEEKARLRKISKKLYNAVRSNDYEGVKRYVLMKGDTNFIKDKKSKETLLHIAAANGNVNVARVLVSHGADVNALTVKDWTPMHHATRFGHLDTVKYLMQNGASMYRVNSDGKNPFALALQIKNEEIIRFLTIWRKYH